MVSKLELVAVERPSPEALQQAIRAFADDAPEGAADDAVNAMLVIVGEACAQLDAGAAVRHVIDDLGRKGLAEGCATPFVEKANEIVASQRSRLAVDGAAPFRRATLASWALGALAVAAVAGVVWAVWP